MEHVASEHTIEGNLAIHAGLEHQEWLEWQADVPSSSSPPPLQSNFVALLFSDPNFSPLAEKFRLQNHILPPPSFFA